ncbi:MAG: hypothetical protein QW520_01110 [Methanomassiliicoccales archaeon]
MKLWRDQKGEVGAGTTVLFITIMLTATGAASLVIDQTNEAQVQANAAALDALMEISTGLWPIQALGHVQDGLVDRIELYMKLQPGSPEIAMEEVVILFLNDDGRFELLFSPSYTSKNTYMCEMVMSRSNVSTLWNERHVLGPLDIIKITITNEDKHLALTSYEEVFLYFMLSSGSSLELKLKIPLICQDGWITLL